ncbi:MAG: glycosyl transferase [Candidatus Binatia bacterium]|nr:MAG: glycosyl transferase [Candidatus Binatia bacterium]
MRIAAITVNWNRTELTLRCLESLLAARRAPDEIYVVDNGSDPDPSETFRACWPGLRVLRHPRNLGFAAGVNLGLREGLRGPSEAFFVVNNDAVVHEDCLVRLEEALEEDPTRAVVGAKTLTRERPPRIHTAYGVLTFHGPLVQQRGWMEEDIRAYDRMSEVDYVSGCAMLLRREAVERVGLFDEFFFAYHEDLDWCTRAWKAGFRVVYVPSAIVFHEMHASTGGGGYESPITYLSQRNAILFVKKHATKPQLLKFALHLPVNLLKDAVLRARRREWRGYRLRVRGLVDGLLGREVPVSELGLDGHGSS